MSRAILRMCLAAFALTAAAAWPAHAQPTSARSTVQPAGQISGRVRYADTKQPAYNVLVSCDGFSGGFVGQVQTDRSGRFTFNNLDPAQFTVRIRAPGYLEEQQTVELQTTSSAYLNVELRPDPSEAGTAARASVVSADPNLPPAAQKEYERAATLMLAGAKKESIDEGITHLEKAVSLYPKYYDAQLLLGTSYMDAKQWEKAEAALRRAVEINPKGAGGYFALGEVLRRAKKYDEAERVITDGLKLDEKSAQGHFTLGEVYWEKGDIPKAGVQVGTALQLKPDHAEAHLLAGNILLRARKAESALAQFEEYLRLAPDGEFAPKARELSQKIKDALGKKQ